MRGLLSAASAVLLGAQTCLALNLNISTATSASVAAVPTGTPVPGDYNGRYRPQVHYSPPQGFMNDPNGMFRDANGTWHLYYQYNPTANVAGNQHWGHATSDDLYTWVNQPIALFPPDKNTFVFSGSAVVDTNNTSGFFPNQDNGVVAIYTLANYPDDGSAGPQTQAIAYSHDGGYSFTPYANNPVIPSNSSQFRDPKVFRYDDHWVMAVAYPYDFEVGIFTSPDLKSWTAQSNFSHHGMLAFQWECPNLVKIPYVDEAGRKQDDMWVMAISVNPGAPVGGSIMQYYPGHFNGTHFEAVDNAMRIADFAKDNYAGQFFYDQQDRTDPVFIAWASNWQYTQVVPTGDEGWRSPMSVPRKTHLTKAKRVGWKLVNEVYDLSPIRGESLLDKKDHGNGSLVVDFSEVESNAVYWEANITGIPSSGVSGMATLNFTFASPISGENLKGGYYLGGDTPFFLDRSGTKGFDNVFFTDKFSTNSLAKDDGSWSMSGILDRSMLEVFLQGGLDSATALFFSNEPLTQLTLATANLPKGAKVSLRVEELKSPWKAAEAADGIVYGNTTAPVGGIKSRGAFDSFAQL